VIAPSPFGGGQCHRALFLSFDTLGDIIMPIRKSSSAHGANVRLTMLPISAGDVTLIVWSDGHSRHSVLIGAGFREDEAISYLQSIGIFHLDLIILSHPDMDHLGGLLALVKSRAMTVDRIWCFDLTFLREFITTGKIPPPQPATREVLYDYLLRATLDQFSDILTSANGRGIQVLQVSEDYRLSLGGVLLEVLYPPESFYSALRSPSAITQLLVNRKWPDDWTDERQGREGGREKARPLSRQERQKRLAEMVDKPEMPEDGLHLTELEELEEKPNIEASKEETLPWRMVGTLYNNLSIVVKLTILGGIDPPSILLPGDLSDWTMLILRQWTNLRADVLKMPHHGSRNIGFDSKALSRFIDHCIHWHFFERHCQCFFACCGPHSSHDFERLEHLIHSGDATRFIQEIVAPSQILVFPHPQHKLPTVPLAAFNSKIISNRIDRDPLALAAKTNAPCPATLLVGLERGEVHEAKL
jgi:hypothetical protein